MNAHAITYSEPMELQVKLLIAALHGLAGILLVAGTYRAVEYRLQTGVLFGTMFALAVLAVDFTVGPMLFDFTLSEVKTGIWSAVIGAVIGVSAMVTLVEPELDSDSTTTDITNLEQ